MESFAATDYTYSDGQKNREDVPAEIVKYGFKPPVKLPDGSIQKGDYLSANHLNYMFNDLYATVFAYKDTISGIDDLRSEVSGLSAQVDEVLEGEAGQQSSINSINESISAIETELSSSLKVVEKSGNNTAGYVKYSNGDVEAWGVADIASGDNGKKLVTYPTAIPGVIMDIIVSEKSQDNEVFEYNNVNSVKFYGPTQTGFTIKSNTISISGSTVTVVKTTSISVRWRAKYHA